MAPLDLLPNDLLLMIAESLNNPDPDFRSLFALLLTSQRFNYLLTPFLYKLALLDTPDGTPALHWATHHDHMHLASILVNIIPGSALSHRHPTTGSTALHTAVSLGLEPHVSLLLSRGASATATDNEGDTPLHVCESITIAQLLLNAGAGIYAQNNLWETSLHKATRCEHADNNCEHTEIVKLFLRDQHQESINTPDHWGNTPLMCAAMWQHNTRNGNPQSCKDLIDHGAFVNLQNREGMTALHMTKNKKIIHLLLKAGADCTLEDIYGKTAIQNWSKFWSMGEVHGNVYRWGDIIIKISETHGT